MRDEMFDVVIVGYGPVGQMTAILLGQKGHRVGVFEHWPQIYALPRAVHYDDEIARIFQAAGVTDQVLKITEAVPDFYEWRNKAGEALLRLDWSGTGNFRLAGRQLLRPAATSGCARYESKVTANGPGEPGLGGTAFCGA